VYRPTVNSHFELEIWGLEFGLVPDGLDYITGDEHTHALIACKQLICSI